MAANEPPDEARYREIGAELLESWNAHAAEPEFNAKLRNRKWSQQQAVTVHSLAAHVHRLYPVIDRLLGEGLGVETLPLLRTAFESALTAHWIAQTDDGLQAFLNEDVRSRRNLEKTAVAGLSEAIRGGKSIHGIDLEPLETSAAGPARNFNQLCDDLTPGGASAYFIYRVMSAYSHPSAALVDQYLQDGPSDALPFALRFAPKDQRTAMWLGLAVSSLIWAGRAVDYFDPSRTRRSQLRRCARDVGITSELNLSPTAYMRQMSAKRKPRKTGA